MNHLNITMCNNNAMSTTHDQERFFLFKYHLEIHGDDWGMVKWQPVKYPYDFQPTI